MHKIGNIYWLMVRLRPTLVSADVAVYEIYRIHPGPIHVIGSTRRMI